LAGGPDLLGGGEGHIAGAGADVQHPHAGPNAGVFEQAAQQRGLHSGPLE